MHLIAVPLALLPAALHWWWTRSIVEASASAVLPERHLAAGQRVSFVTMLCTMTIVTIAQWHAAWILPVQFVALAVSAYRARRVMFAETWTFRRYLSWRVRFHTGMFGLWWFVALAPVLVAQASPRATWWLAGLLAVIALAWHHWSGRLLLVLLRASRLERPDLDSHFQRVFAAARVLTPDLWRAGVAGGRLANAFAMITVGQRGVLFFDSLLDQLTPDEITAILAHEVAHLEQFDRRRLLGRYLVTTALILLLMLGSAAARLVIPAFESWVLIVSLSAVFAAMWVRARRMQGHETDADLRAIELCGDAEALIRALTRIYEINHIPRRWPAVAEQRSTHPSLARRIRSIRERIAPTQAPANLLERLVVASSEPGRCALIDHYRVGFLWLGGELGDPETMLDRARRVEMTALDQLSELRLSTTRGTIELVAVGHQARQWSMPIAEADAARVQAALDRIDHLVVAPAPRRELGILQRAVVLVVVFLAAPFNAIGAVLAPALLALRRPTRPIMMAFAAALAGTAVASVNEPDVPIVRIALLAILSLVVLPTTRQTPRQGAQPDQLLWIRIERLGVLLPVVIGLILVAANARDLYGAHAAIRDRSWFTAALAAMAVFHVAHTNRRTARRAGLSIAVLATASFVAGSPWFLLHIVADPLVAAMPSFIETTVPAITLAQRSVDGNFSAVRVTPDGNHVLLSDEDDEAAIAVEDESASGPQPKRFVAAGFDGWSRELRAFDVAIIDSRRLLVLDRAAGSSQVRAEDLRSGEALWAIALPDLDVTTVQAAPDGRWRAFSHRGRQFERLDGRIGTTPINSTRWTVAADNRSYVDMPRNDGGRDALAVAAIWQGPVLSPQLSDWRQTTRLLRVDSARTSELATSNLRVECPVTPIEVSGYVCISFDGRWSRVWQVDLGSGTLMPIAETRQMIWNPWQPSEQHLAGVANGRPLLADLDSQTLITLVPDKYCWALDVAIAREVMVGICGDGSATTVMQYRLPAELH
jgi:Zn-dependent protease with chaperone function